MTSLLRKPLAFEGRFTQFPNSWVRDRRIGFRAKGVLALLMSHNEGWRVSLAGLAEAFPDGITAIRTAVQELEDAGYLTRETIRNDKSQVESTEWIITDPFEVDEPTPLENLTSGNLTSGFLMQKNIYIKENNIKEDISSDDFEIFWKIYPRKIGKGAARAAFEKACKKENAKSILQFAEAYANSPDLPDLQFIPHPSTWLNQERWCDDLNTMGTNATQIASDILSRGKALQQRVEGMNEIEH